MDQEQEIEIINSNTRKEKIKNFFINYKKKIIFILILIVLLLISFFLYQDYRLGIKEKLSDKYNIVVTKFESGKKENIENEFKEIINEKDKTYSPLAFYFLIDN